MVSLVGSRAVVRMFNASLFGRQVAMRWNRSHVTPSPGRRPTGESPGGNPLFATRQRALRPWTSDQRVDPVGCPHLCLSPFFGRRIESGSAGRCGFMARVVGSLFDGRDFGHRWPLCRNQLEQGDHFCEGGGAEKKIFLPETCIVDASAVSVTNAGFRLSLGVEPIAGSGIAPSWPK